MTVEERIKEVEKKLTFAIADETKASTKKKAYDCGYHDGYQDALRHSFNLIKELQNKNKELKASFPMLKTDRDTLAVKLLKEKNEKLKDRNKELEAQHEAETMYYESKNESLTRLEVIDESGRVYVNNNCKMELSYQDEGRTLKIFVNNEGIK